LVTSACLSISLIAGPDGGFNYDGSYEGEFRHCALAILNVLQFDYECDNENINHSTVYEYAFRALQYVACHGFVKEIRNVFSMREGVFNPRMFHSLLHCDYHYRPLQYLTTYELRKGLELHGDIAEVAEIGCRCIFVRLHDVENSVVAIEKLMSTFSRIITRHIKTESVIDTCLTEFKCDEFLRNCYVTAPRALDNLVDILSFYYSDRSIFTSFNRIIFLECYKYDVLSRFDDIVKAVTNHLRCHAPTDESCLALKVCFIKMPALMKQCPWIFQRLVPYARRKRCSMVR